MVSSLPDILPLRPFLKELVWGGRRLGELLGKELPPDAPIGEALEVSALEGAESSIAAGPLGGRNLRDLVQEFGEALLGREVVAVNGQEFPLLVKFIDAHEDLSIQVHPDDTYARRAGLNHRGKMEAWYILHSTNGRVVYGMRNKVDREELVNALQGGKADDVLRTWDVHRGDVIFVPPGTIHAIGGGVVLYEIQQASDLTFRLHDYDRLGLNGRPRELQTDQALEVAVLEPPRSGPTNWRQLPGADDGGALVVECEHFALRLHCLSAGEQYHDSVDYFQTMTVIQGEARLAGKSTSHTLQIGASALIPAGRSVMVEQQENSELEYLVGSPNFGHKR